MLEGVPSFASMHLTGAPADHLSSDLCKFYEGGTGWTEDVQKIEEFWSKIEFAHQKGCTLLGTTKSN